jgi:type IV pilus assembly protein PilX
MRPTATTLRRAQRGAVLFISLIVLVAMSLAGLAMMRGVDTGAQIANNLAFKQGATMAGDAGVEAARTWLMNNPGATLYNDQPGVANGVGYFATWQQGLDFTNGDADTTNNFDWTTRAVALATDAAGNQASYVIHRMCDATGNPASINCIRVTNATGSTSSSSKGAAAFGSYAISSPSQAFFRITVRVIGPRNTVSYVQAVVY